MDICPKCNALLKEKQKFCTKCGEHLVEREGQQLGSSIKKEEADKIPYVVHDHHVTNRKKIIPDTANRKSKKGIYISIGGILFALIAGGSYYFYKEILQGSDAQNRSFSSVVNQQISTKYIKGHVIEILHPRAGAQVSLQSDGKIYQFALGTENGKFTDERINVWESTLNKLKPGDLITIEYNEALRGEQQIIYGMAIRAKIDKEIVEKKQDQTENSVGMKLVLIPAGTFMMGPSHDGGWESSEPHQVTISQSFYMQATEVTQKQWKWVMGKNPSSFSGCGDDCPVEMVSWNDIQDFIRKLNKKEGTDKYRLPSEAEWEYAARAGTTTKYSFGDNDDNLGDYAWYGKNSGNKTLSMTD